MNRRDTLRAIGATVGFGSIAGIGFSSNPGGGGDDNGEAGDIELVGEVETPGAREVAVTTDGEGRYAFVGNGELGTDAAEGGDQDDTGFSVVDWSDPRNPELVRTVDVPGPEHSGVDIGGPNGDILGVSNDAFGSPEVDPGQTGAQFYDISDPEDPERISYFDVNPAGEAQLGAHNLFVDDDGNAFLTRFFPRDDTALISVGVRDTDADDQAAELDRWTIDDAAGLNLDSFEDGDPDHKLNNPHQVYVEDGRAYIAHWDAGCQVLDVSDPGDMRRIGSFGETEGWTDAPADGGAFRRRFSLPPGNVHSVRAFDDGNYAALGVETGQIVQGGYDTLGGVEIYDISDLSEPELVAGIAPVQVKREDQFEKGGTAHNLTVQGDEIHSAWYAGGVRVFDVSDPGDPEEVDRFDPEGTDVAYDTAAAAGRYTVATRRTQSVVVLDVQPARTGPPPE